VGINNSCCIGSSVLLFCNEKEEMKLASKGLDLFFYFYFFKDVEDSL